jgi:hypothetical protein
MVKMENLVSYTLSTENNQSWVIDGDLREEDDNGGEISKFVRMVERKWNFSRLTEMKFLTVGGMSGGAPILLLVVARLAAGQHEAHREGGRVRNGVEMGADGFGLLSGMFPNMDSIFHIHEWIRSSLTSQTEESVSTPLSSVNKGTLNQRAFPEQRRRWFILCMCFLSSLHATFYFPSRIATATWFDCRSNLSCAALFLSYQKPSSILGARSSGYR